jgi:hypothetical protein
MANKAADLYEQDWGTIWRRDVLAEAGLDLADSESSGRRRHRGATSVGGKRVLVSRSQKNK